MREFLESKSLVKIIDTIKTVDFFDGSDTQLNCSVDEMYWLCCSDHDRYGTSYISFLNRHGVKVNMPVFNYDRRYYKSLSDYSPPHERGFLKEDLLELIKCFGLKASDTKSKTLYAQFRWLPHLELNIKIESDNIYFLIYTIVGGRAPEAVYFVGVYEVLVTEKFITQYIT